MKLSRFLAIILFGLMIVSSPSLAKPSGQGDAKRAFSCMDSCHIGPTGTDSSATVNIELDRERVFTSQLLSLSIKTSGMELSKKGLVGVFLLADDGSPLDDWKVVQDPNGGNNNYVEKPVFSSTQGATFTWILQAPDNNGNYSIDAVIHHGADPNPDEYAYLGRLTTPLLIEVEPMPEDLPRFSDDWKTTSSRDLGDETTIIIETEDTDDLIVEWRTSSSETILEALLTKQGDGIWSFTLPASSVESNLTWRAKLSNPALEEVTPWFTLSSSKPNYDIDERSLMIQAIAGGILAAAIAIAMQRRFAFPTQKGGML